VLICLFGVFVGLLLAEIILEGLGAVPSFQTYSASRGWRLRSGATGWQSREGVAHVAINADGRRGPRVAPAKPPGTLRIAVLGDSFVEAIHVPYEDSVCAVLTRELARRCPGGARVEVLNFGVSGYSTAQELLTLREEVWRYAPDVVVLAVFTGNDISDNSPLLDSGTYFNGERCRPYFRYQDGGLVLRTAFAGDGLFPLYCKLNFEGRRFAVLRLMGTGAEVLARQAERLSGSDRLPGSEPGLDDAIYAPPADDAWRDAWDITERLIVTVAQEVAVRRARFLAVTLSNPVQVYPDEAYRRRYLAAVHGTDIFYPDRRIETLGARHGFEVLGLAPAMQRLADRERVFFHGFAGTGLGVGHWNPRGHEFAGRAIARALAAGGTCEERRPAP
jgi:hypothetical protein